MATKMYQLPNILLAGLTCLINSNPHFWNGSSGKIVTTSTRFCFNKLPIIWHWSWVQQYSWTSRFVIGHQYPTSKIFFTVISKEKCLLVTPQYNFYKIRQNLLSCPNMYNTPFWSTNGLVLWAKYCLGM